MIAVFDWVEKNFGKRRKCWLLAFSPFCKKFSKAPSTGLLNPRAVKQRVKHLNSCCSACLAIIRWRWHFATY